MQHPSSIYKTKRSLILYFMAIALCMLLAACNVDISSSGTGFQNTTDATGSTLSSGTNGGTIGSGAQGVQVFVEPDAGDQVITNAISNAKKSVWMEMYLLTDRKVISALEEAAQRGLDVRVMLETHPYGSGSVSPTETLNRLQAANVKTEATSSAFALTHEKGMVLDGSTAYIMTCNLTLSALGSSKSTENREYGIIDNNQPDVQAVSTIFTADWNRTSAQYNDPNLVVSPDNSRSSFAALINGAQKTLQIEAEEMQDNAIEQDLVNAARRGVQIQVILPSASSSSDSNTPGISTIQQGGIKVEESTRLYMHAKIIIVDGQKAFVGSENISTASLNKNRELGIIVSDQSVLNTLQQTFQQDWGQSKSI